MSNEKKIKVAFVLGALNRGGTESLILDVCRRAESTLFEVVCVYRKEGNLSDEFHMTNAKLIRLPKSSHMLSYISALRKLLINEKVDIAHSQTPSNTMVLGLALIGTSIKLVTSFHGHSFAHSNWFKCNFVYKISKKIICVSENQKQFYQTHWHLGHDNKLEVVHNGIDTNKFDNIKYPKPDFLENQTPKSINLVVVGSFCSGRSQDFLLLVINHIQETLREKCIKIYFIGGPFVGEEYIYKQCEEYIQEHHLTDIAIMLGVRNDVLTILHYVDGFLYSTRTDTFGIAVVEAMMSGLPVITNDYVVMKEVTHDGALATLYKSNDIDDCSQKILTFLEYIDEYKTKACKIKEHVKNLYSIDNHIKKLMNIYQKL